MGGGGSQVPNIFGDGSDGNVIISADTLWNAETEDTGMIVKNFESLTIAENVTVAAGNRNCGMIIRVKGDCTIHGTLKNKLSCKTLLDSDNVDFSSWPLTMLSGKGGDGGNGGSCNDVTDSYNKKYSGAAGGIGMIGRFYGGGWSGGGSSGLAYRNDGSGNGTGAQAGGNATEITTAVSDIFIGTYTTGTYGAGGGWSRNSYDGYRFLGASGPGGSAECMGGGCGNIGGGVIILMIGGKLTFDGTIDCTGSPGGNGANCTKVTDYLPQRYVGLGGGGSGGGRIFICHKGDIVNIGTLDVTGGVAGIHGTPIAIGITNTNNGYFSGVEGTNGGNGDITIKTFDEYKAEDIA